ncbi:MAG: glycosyltransferase family 2 protein [Proteobacteria bacterium]|nr:glycosyltransferase family 2 protein [Pseudomonadota bacterium]
MKISIVTACYNSASTIEDTLASVAEQTHPEIEHIIVDGCSTDRTMEIVNRHRDRLAKVVSAPDSGIYDAMNKGIALASGDVIGFLNSDDVFASAVELEFVAKAFEDPAIEACYADLVYVAKHDPGKVVRYWKSNAYRYGQFRTGWMPAHPTFYVRRAIYVRFGGFDLQFRLQADFELAMRLLEVHRIRSIYIPRVLVKMRVGGATNNSLANILKGNLEAYRACLKNGLPVTPFFMLGKILSRIPQFFVRPPN